MSTSINNMAAKWELLVYEATEVIYKICLQLNSILFYICYQGPQPQMQIKYIYWQWNNKLSQKLQSVKGFMSLWGE